MKRVVLLVSVLLTLGSAIGCGQDEPATETGSTPEEGSIVSASSASLELGVDHWRVNAEGLAFGVDADGARVAEFHLDGTAGVVTSVLPERGTAAIDGSGSALSGRSRAFYDALVRDVGARVESASQSKVEASGAEQAVDKAVYGCYALWNDCDLQGFYGILNGWWTGYICEISNNTRPYCGNLWALLY
jgi:hypothetical protein